MDLSVVIRCCDDYRVFDCIKSIDEDVEIIVSMCKNQQLSSKFQSLGIKYCIVPAGNLSITSNKGIKLASHNKIILTDSDTIFSKHAIKNVYYYLDDYDIVDLRIFFNYSRSVPFSKVVAEARDYVNSLPVLFTPGIGFTKNSIPKIGGFFYNKYVPFAVDAELNHRYRTFGLRVKKVNDASISHVPEKLKHDLHAAKRIGGGCKIGQIILKNYYEKEHLTPKTKISLKAVKLSMYPDIFIKKGLKTLFYQVLWDFMFYLGYFQRV